MKSKKQLNKLSMDKTELFNEMDKYKIHDIKWKEGRAFSLVFYGGEELNDITKTAYNKFFSENALNPSAFPSLKNFENEVVSMVGNLLKGGEDVVGNMTSGGTESILMAVKTAREWAKKNKPNIKQPEMIMPISAHPAFNKACHYFGIKLITANLDDNYTVDLNDVKSKINGNTILLVGSAPNYPYGVIDPIEELSKLALEMNLLLHVDGCVGGFVLPFLEKLGKEIPKFCFELEGVTSLSVDLHKYAYAAKGASVILYKNKELRRHQFFVTTDWPGGLYGSPTILGTRPGGAIAAAWAILNYLGEEGYLKLIGSINQTTQEFVKRINNLKDIMLVTQPDMSILSLKSETVDIFQVNDGLQQKGWHLDGQQNPNSIHLTITHAHGEIIDEFFTDLKIAIDDARKQNTKFSNVKAGLQKKLLNNMPAGMVTKIIDKESQKVGTEDERSGKMAPMYGMMASIKNNEDKEMMVLNALDNLFSAKKNNEEEGNL
jgi:sphinganine-1-phosphate aldolase